MKILYLSQVLPWPLDAGPKMRSYFALKHLARRHDVTLVTFVRPTDKPEHIAEMERICAAVHTVPMPRAAWRDGLFLLKSLLTGQPFLIARDEVSAMGKLLRRLALSGQFDAIHADQLWMAQYALRAKTFAPNARLVLDQHNAVCLIPRRMAQGETNIAKKMVLARESWAMTRYEPRICAQFDHVVWVTAEDLAAVRRISAAPMPPVTVIPICADPESVAPLYNRAAGGRITFLGGLHWPPNAQGIAWFAKTVFPQIKQAVPAATLTVVGKNPPPELAGMNGIEVTGYAPDLRPYLAETAVFIVPLHAGGGMRVKIIDAWSWGLPIVSTTIGAEGIDITPGRDILIADEPAAFAETVTQVLLDAGLAAKIAAAGRQTVLQKYNWRTVYTAWDEIYG